MRMSFKRYMLVILISLLSVHTAQAGFIKWVLDDVVFNDQSTAYGSYFYDADTNTYSNIDITTSTSGTNYNVVHPGSYSSSVFLSLLTTDIGDQTGGAFLSIALDEVMTSMGGTIAIVPDFNFSGGTGFSFEGLCINPTCTGLAPNRGISSGSVTANVPEPSTLAIFALGLMGLASRRFKKRS